MNKNAVKDILNLKMKIIDSITEHLPDLVRDRIYAAQHDVITSISEVANEYLEKKKTNENNKDIKNVTIE